MVQAKHLSKVYIHNLEIQKYYKFLKVLCFIPPGDVIEAFLLISKDAPASFIPILNHLERYYISKFIYYYF